MEIIQAARELMGDTAPEINPEYFRALVELTAHVLGIARDEDRHLVESLVLGHV